jgi:TusE/DsrC/DsvC family sulfur relay protein
MQMLEIEGKKIHVDDEGYLINFEDWNEKVACALADREGVSKTCPLTDDKLEILKFIRKNYKLYNAFPIPAAVCRNLHQPSQCVVEKFLEPSKAWKIAGLPKPSLDTVAYMKAECGW